MTLTLPSPRAGRGRPRRFRGLIAGGVLALAALLGPPIPIGDALLPTASAQTTGGPRPPVPRRPDTPSPLGAIFMMVLLAGLVVTASLFPSKRGHQD